MRPECGAGRVRRLKTAIFRGLAWGLVLAAMAGTGGLAAEASSKAKPSVESQGKAKAPSLSALMASSAEALLDSAIPAKACGKPDYHPSIGLWTFPQEEAPVSEGAARRIYDELLAQIMNNKPRCLDVLDSAGIGAVIQHLSKSGALEQSGGDTLGALESAHQMVDFVMFPDLFEQKGKIYLGLKIAERKTGRTMAVAKPIEIPASFTSAETGDAARSLDTALSDAAADLLAGERKMSEVTSAGLFFEDSYAQPEAGRFLMDQLLAKLVERGSNPLTGNALRVRAITVETATPTGQEPATILPEEAARQDGAYVLSGRYWIRGNAFELVLTLAAPDGSKKMWRGPIKLTEFQGMDLEPKNSSTLAPPLPRADYVFEVTTTKGTNPVFRVGDQLNLRMRLGRQSWVYCFYVASDGSVTPIFPLPRAVAGNRQNPLKARRTMLLPDPATDKFRFRISPETVGEELVSCYATGRDVANDLPPEMLPDKPAVVPFLTLDTVRNRFRALPDASVAEALVTMTIAK